MNLGHLGVKLSAVEILEPRYMMAGDPLAEWRFDSNSGTVLVDSIGTSSVGTVTGSSVYNQTATALSQRHAGVDGVEPDAMGHGHAQWRLAAVQRHGRRDRRRRRRSAGAVGEPVVQGRQHEPHPVQLQHAANGGSTSGTSVAMPLFETGNSAAGLNIYIYNNRLYVGAWNNGVAGWTSGTFLFTPPMPSSPVGGIMWW